MVKESKNNRMAKKIAIAIHKGGVGKTTTATNLAAALALRGLRTLLVDLDEQANATKGLGFDPGALPGTLFHIFDNPNLEVWSAVFEAGLPKLHILPAHANLARTEKGMTLQAADLDAPDPRVALRSLLAPLEE